MADSTVIGVQERLNGKGDQIEAGGRSPLRTGAPSTAKTASGQIRPQAKRSTTTVTDKTLSMASNLVKLLPTGTVLAFQSLMPSFSNHGACYTTNAYLVAVLVVLCTLSCFFFSFTDSLVGLDGKLYYGIATFRGFYAFNYDGPDDDQGGAFRPDDLRRLRIRALDYVHAFFAELVFLTVAFGDSNVQSCFFAGAGRNAGELLINLPLGSAFLSTLVFLIFPTTRKGIGYSEMEPEKQGSPSTPSPSFSL